MSAETEQDLARLHAYVSGYVQGVGFRYFTLRTAQQLALVGWVRNLSDGSVEVVAEGRKAVLEAFLTELKRGPQSSRVENVRYTWYPARGEFNKFEVTF